jgi:hypothetical protein
LPATLSDTTHLVCRNQDLESFFKFPIQTQNTYCSFKKINNACLKDEKNSNHNINLNYRVQKLIGVTGKKLKIMELRNKTTASLYQ